MFRAFGSFFLLAASCAFAGIGGTWSMSADGPDGRTYKFDLAVQASGTQVSGTIESEDLGHLVLQAPAFSNNELTFKVPHPEAGTVQVRLRLDGDSLKGSLITEDGDTGTVAGARVVTVAGSWNVQSKAASGGVMKVSLDLRVSNGKLSGEAGDGSGSVAISNAELKGSEFRFAVDTGEETYSVQGSQKDNRIEGTYKSSSGETGTFIGERAS